MDALLAVLVMRVAASPALVDAGVGVRRLQIAFTNRSGVEPKSVVWAQDAKVAQVLTGYTVRQWVGVWNALLVSRDTGVYKWRPGNNLPELLIDLKGFVPTTDDDGRDYPICSVNQTGRQLAVIVNYGLFVIDLQSRKVTFRNTEDQIGKALRRQPLDAPHAFGIAWNPTGTAVAMDLPTKAYVGASDGVGPSQCVVVFLDGRVKRLGIGAPVAWLSNINVLCAVSMQDSDLVEPRILALDGTRPRTYHRLGMEVGWDGSHILLSHPRTVEAIDATTLRRLALVDVPQLEEVIMSTWTPLVGIPNTYRVPTSRTSTRRPF